MAYKIKKKKSVFIKEPYGLPFELTSKDKFINSDKKDTFELKKQGYEDGEWANQFYVWEFNNGKEEFKVYYDTTQRISPYSVVYEGAVDFDGNKKELLKKYPEMKKYLK